MKTWRFMKPGKGPVNQASFLASLNVFSIHCHSLVIPQRSQTKDMSITRTLDGRGSTPLQKMEDKTCNISVTCCFLWGGRCPSAMTPRPKETSWACTPLVRPLPPSPASGSLVDFERSLEQQLRRELNVKARNVCTVRKTWLISRGVAVISDLIISVKLLDMNHFKLHFQLHKCLGFVPIWHPLLLNLFYKSWSVEADIHQQYHQDETSWGMNSEWELLPVKSWRVTVMTRQMGEASEQSCLGIHHCQPHASVF